MTATAQALPLRRDQAIKTIAGIDLSSWLSWTCYGIGFGAATRLSPAMADDLTGGGIGVAVLAGAVAMFFVLVLVIQNQMHVSLTNTAFGEPCKLVNSGIFAVSRNPMYVAFLLPVLSLAIFSPLAALGACGLYIAAMNSLVIADEEVALAAAFGNQFRRYCLATPRWLIW